MVNKRADSLRGLSDFLYPWFIHHQAIHCTVSVSKTIMILQVKCLKFKVPKVKGIKMTITCFGPVFIGLKMGFPILSNYAHLIPLIALQKPSDDVRLHKPFPSMVHCIAELSHKLHFLLAKRALAECRQIFLKLFNVRRRYQTDIDVGIREHKAIAHTSGGNGLVFWPAARPSEQIPPAGGGIISPEFHLLLLFFLRFVRCRAVLGVGTFCSERSGNLAWRCFRA